MSCVVVFCTRFCVIFITDRHFFISFYYINTSARSRVPAISNRNYPWKHMTLVGNLNALTVSLSGWTSVSQKNPGFTRERD